MVCASEMELLQSGNKVRIAQWEEAQDALSKRNEIIQTITAQRTKFRDEFMALQTVNNGLKDANTALTKERDTAQLREREWRDKLVSVETELRTERSKYTETEKELRTKKSEFDRAKADV